MSEVLTFEDLEPVTVPVRIGDKEYVLRQASTGAAVKYKNCMTKSTVFGLDGRPCGVDGVHDAEPLLVSLCLFELYGEGKERPVLLSTVLGWPSDRVEALFRKAKEISGLDKDAKRQVDPLKNEHTVPV